MQQCRESLRLTDWVYAKSHENQEGNVVFKTIRPYQALKTWGRRLTIESHDEMRTMNGNLASRAPDPLEGTPVWSRALAA